MKRTSILLVALLALVVAACSSETADSPSTTASEAAATPEPTPEASAEAGESGSPAAIPSIDLDGDPELAARFPDTVGGQPLVVQSMRGDQLPEMGTDQAFQDFLDSIDAQLEDVSVAFGGATFGESVLSVGAFRVLGAEEDELEREFIAASEEAGDVTALDEATVGGKEVLTGTDPSGQSSASVFIYTKDDTLYFFTGSEEQVAEVLEVLP